MPKAIHSYGATYNADLDSGPWFAVEIGKQLYPVVNGGTAGELNLRVELPNGYISDPIHCDDNTKFYRC